MCRALHGMMMWQIARSAMTSSPASTLLYLEGLKSRGPIICASQSTQVNMQTMREGMASCSGRMHSTETSQIFFAQQLPSGRLQQLLRSMHPDSFKQSRRRNGEAQKICAVAAVAEVKGKASRMPSLPFVKVAEQEDMKLALMLNVIDPSIGGVLIMGERGTGKSVAVWLVHHLSDICNQCPSFVFPRGSSRVRGAKMHC